MTNEKQKTDMSLEEIEEIEALLTEIRAAASQPQMRESIHAFIRKIRENEAMTYQDLVQDLARERQRQQVSQRALAVKLQTKQPNLARMEQGHQPPKIDTLQRYAEALGKRITWIIEDA